MTFEGHCNNFCFFHISPGCFGDKKKKSLLNPASVNGADRMALLGHLSAAFAYYSGQRTLHNGISPLNPCLSVDAKCATKALKAVMYFYVQKLMQFKIVSIGKPQKFLIMLNLRLPQKCLD